MGRRRTRRQHEHRSGQAVATVEAAPGATDHEAKAGRRDGWLIFLILLAAMGLRVAVILQMRASPLFEAPIMDELYHDEWARAIAGGETYIDGPYFRAPLYPAFLAAIHTVFGHGFLAPRLIQAALGAFSCVLLFVIGRRMFDRTIGAVAAFIAASYWVLIYFDAELLIPSLIVLLDLLLIWLLLLGAQRPRGATFVLAGLVLGLSALARPNVLLFVPAVVVWLLVRHWQRRGRGIGYAACVTLGCLLPIVPVTIRNHVVGDDVVLISSQAGVNFYIGNNPRSDGHTAIVPGTPGGWWEGYRATIERAERATGRDLKPSEVSRYYFGEAFKWIAAQPGDFLALTWLKARLFWTSWEISNNKGIYFWSERFAPTLSLLPLGFAVVGPLGLLGLLMSLRRRSDTFPLWGFVLVYTASVVVFFCTSRYRVPVLPPLILLATFAVAELIGHARRRNLRALTMYGSILLIAALFVNLPPGGPEPLRNDAFSYVRLGGIYSRAGKWELAENSYRSALDEGPSLLIAHYKLANTLYRQERLDEAIEHYRHALASPPKLSVETDQMVAKVHFNLARTLERAGTPEQAASHYQAAYRLDSTLRTPRQ